MIIGKSVFQVIYGRSTKGLMNLVKLLNLEYKRNVNTNKFVEGINEMHE